MRIAVVSSFFFHYELLPFFVEFAKVHSDWEFDFYLTTDKVEYRDWARAMEWLGCDISKFVVKQVREIEKVERGYYDVIVLPTDNDPVARICRKLQAPMVTINHEKETRLPDAVQLNIRPLAEDHGNDVCLPSITVSKSVSQPMWLDQVVATGPLKGERVIQILVVGVGNGVDGIDRRALKTMMDRPDVQLIIATRWAANIQQMFGESLTGNLPIYIPDAPTQYMMRMMLHSDYVFIPRVSVYIHEKMTGIIPLAVSFQKPMIMPKEMGESMMLDQFIGYDHMALDIVSEIETAVHTKMSPAKLRLYAENVAQHSMRVMRDAIVRASECNEKLREQYDILEKKMQEHRDAVYQLETKLEKAQDAKIAPEVFFKTKFPNRFGDFTDAGLPTATIQMKPLMKDVTENLSKLLDKHIFSQKCVLNELAQKGQSLDEHIEELEAEIKKMKGT